MSVGAFFKKAAPWVASAAASMVPGPVGMAAKLVSEIIGKPVQANPADVNKAVEGMTPEQIEKLQERELEFKETMQKMGFDHEEELEKIAAEDRGNARNREISIRDYTTRILAYTIVGAFVGMAFAVLFRQVRADSVLTGTVIGYLSAKAEQVASYYFGSSAGSDRKTELLAQNKS